MYFHLVVISDSLKGSTSRYQTTLLDFFLHPSLLYFSPPFCFLAVLHHPSRFLLLHFLCSLLSSSSVRRSWWNLSLGTVWWRSSMTAVSALAASTTPMAWWQPTSARPTSTTGACTWAPSARRTSPNSTCAKSKTNEDKQTDICDVSESETQRSSSSVMSWCTRTVCQTWNQVLGDDITPVFSSAGLSNLELTSMCPELSGPIDQDWSYQLFHYQLISLSIQYV